MIDIMDSLSELQKIAIVRVEKEGNGKHVYQIHGLAKAGLMSLVEVEKLGFCRAYRLNDEGKKLKSYLIECGYE